MVFVKGTHSTRQVSHKMRGRYNTFFVSFFSDSLKESLGSDHIFTGCFIWADPLANCCKCMLQSFRNELPCLLLSNSLNVRFERDFYSHHIIKNCELHHPQLTRAYSDEIFQLNREHRTKWCSKCWFQMESIQRKSIN